MGDIMFERIALIGIGLIGSSIARDVRELGLARHVVISTRSEDTLKRAEELALGTDYTVSAAEAVKDADLVIVSVPVGASESVAQQIAPYLKPSAIVTDVGSTKASVIAQMAPHMPENVHFIPGHPLAGTEKSGPDAGFAGLFRERWCIFTPLPGTDAAALERLKDFWRALGSRVDEMDAEHHDKVLAIVSHLPHIIAYNIVGTADDLETVTESEVIKYSASGFRDFTRVMELILAIGIGIMTGSGVWLILRPRTYQVIVGLSLLSYAVNLFIFGVGGIKTNAPPVLVNGVDSSTLADPVPQALVLTAIVIGFATTALFLVVLLAARGLTGTDHVDGRESK